MAFMFPLSLERLFPDKRKAGQKSLMGTRCSNIPSSDGFPQALTLVPAQEAGEAASASVTCAGQGYKALGKSPDPWTQNLRGESTLLTLLILACSQGREPLG